MAGKTGNPSSPSSRRDRPAVAPSAASSGGFALVPQGKYLGKPPISLSRPVIVIGSRNNCRVQLRSESVSKAHALLVKSNNTYYVHDLASRTHVYVDGRRVREHVLRDGEVLTIGSFLLKFVAPAGAPAAAAPSANSPILPASLVPQGGEMPIPMEELALLIGRRAGSDVPLLEASVSSSHSVVFEMDSQHYIRDLGSRTGTFVNGVQVHQHCLNGNDLVRIGETTLRYKASLDTAGTEAASPDLATAELPDAESGGAELGGAEHGSAAELGADELAGAGMAGIDLSEPQPTIAPTVSAKSSPSIATSEDDFGLELLPASEAPVVPAPPQTIEPAAPEPTKEISGPILPGRRGWRAVVPEETSAAPEAPAIAKADDRHLDELDLPLAPDVSNIPDPVTDEPASVEAEVLNLQGLADEDASTIPDVDFDENSLVNESNAPADVIDFALDWEPSQSQAPLLSPDTSAEIAAAEARRKEEERLEAERLEQERAAAAQKAEADRIAAEKAEAARREADRLAAEKAEAERVAAEQARAKQLEAEREAAQRAWAEEAQRVAAEKAEAERVAAETAERERVEAERIAVEKAEAERVEAERIAAAKAEADRIEAERVAAEKVEADRLEAERIAAEKAEAERLEAERLAAERAEAERLDAERIAAEKAEAERIEAECVAAEKAEAERVAAEKAEAERLEAERLAAERAEAERLEAERLDAVRLAAEKAEAERIEAERLAAEKAEAERIAAEKAEADRIEAERIAAEKSEAERVETERLAAEKAAAEKAEAERLAKEAAEAKRLEDERLQAELAAAMGRIDSERIESERAEAEHRIAESLASEETIEKTEPTPDSAFGFHAIDTDQFDDSSPAASDAAVVPLFDGACPASLSDSSFGRAIEDFTGDVSGVLVEPPAEPAEHAVHEPAMDETPVGSDEQAIEPADEPAVEPTAELIGHVSDHPADQLTSEPPTTETFLPDLSLPDSIDSMLTEAPSADADLDFFDEFVSPTASEEHAPEATSLPVAEEPVAEHPVPEQTVAEDETAFLEPIEESEAAASLASELNLGKLAEQQNESSTPTDLEILPLEDDWEPLPSVDQSSDDHTDVDPSVLSVDDADSGHAVGDVAEATDSEPPSAEPESSGPVSTGPLPTPIKLLFPTPAPTVGGAFSPWGGNQENYLGGKPLKLPAAAPASGTPKVESPKVAQPAARVEQPKPPVAPVPVTRDEEDEHIESVSAMIDEILVGEARPNGTSKIPPFSQVSRPPMALPPAPAAFAPRVLPPQPIGRQTSPDHDEPVAPPISATPATRRPLRRGLADMVEQQQKAAARIDEQIPAFGTPLPDQPINRRKSDDAEPLESLAKPPVQETDVFAHTSPPSDEEQAADAELPFVEDPLSPKRKANFAGAATPMDMVFDETNGSRHLSRRVRGGTRFPSAPAAIGAGAAAGIGAAIGRVSLPNDPFWSGSPQASGNSGATNGNGGMDLPPIAAMADALPPRGRHPVRPSPPAFRPSKPVVSRMPDFAYASAEDHSAAITQRKRLYRRVPVLMLLGLMLIAGDLFAIWKLMPPKSIVDAKVTFDHLGNKTELDRHSFIDAQNDLLKSSLTRRHAIEALSKQNPEVPPGFLDSEAEYEKVADSASWPEQNRSVLHLTRVGTDADGDIPRLKAVAIALHDGNGVLVDEAQRNQTNLDETQSLIDQDRKTDDELQKQCDETRAVADGRPSVDQMRQLQEDQDRLEKAWKASVVARDTAEADLQRLQAVAAPSGDGASVSPDAPVIPMASDDQITQMQGQLGSIKAQIDAAKAARVKEAQQARVALDASLAQFEQQVSDAKALSKDNPELSAYISAAQKFQETTRSLVDDLMRRQQQQNGQLTELQARLSDKMDARRQEMWQKDETLQKMNDQLEYAKRQLNAALGTGQEKEAADLKAEVELLESTIKAREDLIPADPFYTDAIDQLQKIVDQQQKSMQEDRQTTAKALDEAQQAFANSQPAVDKLPAEQKSLASDMEKRLADINAARAKYSDAASAVGDGGDDATKKLADQAATIATSIDAHRKLLADATLKNQAGVSQAKRQKDIEDKKAQVADLSKAAKDAEDAYTGKENELQAAQASLAKARAAGDQLQALNDQRMKIDAQLQQLLADVKFKQDAVATSVEPLMITDADIHQHAGDDNRVFYAASTGAPIVVLFMGLILWTIHAASRELPLNALSPSDDNGPEPFALPALEQASHNGHGGGHGGAHGEESADGTNGDTNGHESEEVLSSLTGSLQEGEDGEGVDGENQSDLTTDTDLMLEGEAQAEAQLGAQRDVGTDPQADQQPADAVANN